MRRTIPIALLLAAVLTTAGGCLIVGGRYVEERGVQLSGPTLQQVEVGQTTEAWLLATLGEPTERRAVEGMPNVQILKYTHTIHREEGGAVFILFAGGSHTREVTTTYFELTDGVVTKFWTEP